MSVILENYEFTPKQRYDFYTMEIIDQVCKVLNKNNIKTPLKS